MQTDYRLRLDVGPDRGVLLTVGAASEGSGPGNFPPLVRSITPRNRALADGARKDLGRRSEQKGTGRC
jgi:hypothetical protein